MIIVLFVHRMSLAESELALSESKVNEMSLLLQQAKEEAVNTGKTHQRDLKREREVRERERERER